MNKDDAIIRLLSETKLDTFEQQNQMKNQAKQKKQKTKRNADKKEKRAWKYPAKMK